MSLLAKSTRRACFSPASRFVSLLLIVFLGAGVFAGFRSAATSMAQTAQQFITTRSVPDAIFLDTAANPVPDFARMPHVLKHWQTRTIDLYGVSEAQTRVYTLRSLPADSLDPNPITLVSGQLPTSPAQCLADANSHAVIGDEITFPTDQLSLSALAELTGCTVTGTGWSSDYLGTDRGATALGLGTVDHFLYLPAAAFTDQAPSEHRLSLSVGEHEDRFSTGYRDSVAEEADQILNLLPEGWRATTLVDQVGYRGFDSDLTRVDSLSSILPWLMFALTAMVGFATMARLVAEHRTRIGVFKSQGIPAGQILSGYLRFAGLVGFLGGTLGVVAGVIVLPEVVWGTYATSYHLGALRLSPNYPAVLIGWLGGTLGLLLVTWLAFRKTLATPAAALLRPAAPTPGKQILLSRISWLWRLLPFAQQVSLRNLFRYKFRSLVTIFAVAGATALLLAGLGLRDSIAATGAAQFGSISRYQAMLVLASPSDSTAPSMLNSFLAETDRLYLNLSSAQVSNAHGDNEGLDTFLAVIEEPERLGEFVTLDSANQTRITFPPDFGCAVVTDRLARALGLIAGATGDGATISTRAGDLDAELCVAGVAQNYLYDYLYLGAADYRMVTGFEPGYSSVMVKSDAVQEGWLDELANVENVAAVQPVSDLQAILDEVVANLDGLLVIFIGIAAGLALLVLYNMGDINLTERTRELATMRALGYSPAAIGWHLFRETFALSALGIVLGILAGIGLHEYLVSSVEVGELGFTRTITWQSYAVTVVFILACAAGIALFLQPRIRRLDPVTTLKSAD
jgi:putative ABC transport system permease protein